MAVIYWCLVISSESASIVNAEGESDVGEKDGRDFSSNEGFALESRNEAIITQLPDSDLQVAGSSKPFPTFEHFCETLKSNSQLRIMVFRRFPRKFPPPR